MPASALYDAASAGLAAALAPLSTPPGRSYVAVGAVAFDCDQLTVTLAQMQQVRPGDRALPSRVGPGADLADFRVERVRCVPIPDGAGNPPAASVVDAEALLLYSDGYAIWRALQAGMSDPEFLGGACIPAGLGQLTPVDPQGGVWGWSVTLHAVVDSQQWTP